MIARATRRTILLVALIAADADAQQGLQAANGTTSILTTGFSALSFDAKDASLGLVFATSKTGIPRELSNNFLASIAANKGKRALFSAGEWVPGAHVEDRLAFGFYQDAAARSFVPYVSAGLDVARTYLASKPDPTTKQIVLDTVTTRSNFAGAGFNFQNSALAPVIGFAVKYASDHAVPTAKHTKQVCVIQETGVDAKGNVTNAADCADRYVGGATNRKSGQVRLDIVSPHWWVTSANARQEQLEAESQASTAKLKLDAANAALATAKTRYTHDSTDAAHALAALVAAPDQATNLRVWAEATEVANLAATQVALAGHAVSDAKAESQRRTDAAKEARKAVNNVPTFSLIGAASSDIADGTKPAFNFALGPAVHPPLTPQKVIGALLFEMNDAFNSTGDTPKATDRFTLRVYIGVPF